MQTQHDPKNAIDEPRRSTRRDIDLPSWLAYLYKPLLPYLKQIKIVREETRHHNPSDILLPEGYVAEVVATGAGTTSTGRRPATPG